MEAIYKDYRDKDVTFFYIYTREPHAGQRQFVDYKQTKSIEERLAYVKQCREELGITIPFLVDDMKGTVQRAYGNCPNSGWVIGKDGKVVAKRAWANPEALRADLVKLVGPVENPTRPAGSQPSGPRGPVPQGKRVGTALCLACHKNMKQDWEKSSHTRAVEDPKLPEADRGCEGCHGPGEAHVKSYKAADIIVYKRLDERGKARMCLSCHRDKHPPRQWMLTPHAQTEKSCVSCHDAHNDTDHTNRMHTSEVDLCRSCHTDFGTAQPVSAKHPVMKDDAKCTDCHDPHVPRSEEEATTREAAHGDGLILAALLIGGTLFAGLVRERRW